MECYMRKTEEVKVDITQKYQKWEGFGTSLMWWANAIKDFDKIPATAKGRCMGCQNRYEELLRLLFDEEKGLGLNIVRYNVGGGEDPKLDFINRSGAKIPGYMDVKGVYHWTADSMQMKVLKDAYALIKESKQSFYHTVFSVSPPYFMTYSGSSTGSRDPKEDNLRWDSYEDFVNYFLNVVEYIRENEKIPVTDIEPVNEPSSGYWIYGSQKQEGCQFDHIPQPQRHWGNYDPAKDRYDPSKYSALSKIYEVLGKELEKRQREGRLQDLTICGADETSIDTALISFLSLTDEAKSRIKKITTHEYEGSRRTELRKAAEEYGKNIWMTEVSYGGGSWDPQEMDEGCFGLSSDIRKDLYELGATAWIGWQGIESLGENLLWDSNWGFIHCLYEKPVWKRENLIADKGSNSMEDGQQIGKWESCDDFGMSPKEYLVDEAHALTPADVQKKGFERGDYFVTKQYYTWAQYTRFIKENDRIVAVSDDRFVAALSADEKYLSLIVANEEDIDKEYSLKLQGSGGGKICYALRTGKEESLQTAEDAFFYEKDTIVIRAKKRSVTSIRIKL